MKHSIYTSIRPFTDKLGRMVTMDDGLSAIKSYDLSNTWSCEFMRKIENAISPLPQNSTNLEGSKLRLMVSQLTNHIITPLHDDVANANLKLRFKFCLQFFSASFVSMENMYILLA